MQNDNYNVGLWEETKMLASMMISQVNFNLL